MASLRRVEVAAVAVAIVLAVASVALVAHPAGSGDLAHHPGVVVALVVATLSVLGSAAALSAPEHRATRRLLVATVSAMLGYVALTSALAVADASFATVGLLTEVLVAAQGVGWMPPLALLTLTFGAALGAVGVEQGPLSRAMLGFGTYSAVAGVLALLTTPPAPGSPLADLGPLWDVPAMTAASTVLIVPWMLAVLLVPVWCWRIIPTVPAHLRGRALLVTLAAMTTPITLVFCLAATYLAYVAGLLTPVAGTLGLAVAYTVPFVVGAPLVARALTAPGRLRVPPRHLSWALTLAVGTPLLIATITVGWLFGERFGRGGIALLVVLTLCVGALASVTRRKVVRALMLRGDPVRARAVRAAASLRRPAVSPAADLQQVVRAAVESEEVDVLLLLPDHTWVDPLGQPVASPGVTTTPRVHVEPDSDDAAIALSEIGSLADQALLEVAVRAHQAALERARSREKEAAAAERRRLERDLHDGVQGRLLAVALDLRMAQRAGLSPESAVVVADAVTALSQAIDELRDLSRGTGSRVLAKRGLGEALLEFTARMPLQVRLTAAPDRLPPATEAVVYLVVCEGVTNAVKHSRASSVDVDVAVADDHAVVMVSDDGVGGVDLCRGTGLRGLSERVAAADGRMMVGDRQPRGTLLRVTLPCGS